MLEGTYEAQRQMLVNALIGEGILHSPQVVQAMRVVPREKFVPEIMRKQAYADTPLPIGHGQTISAPHMVAIMAEALELSEGLKVLEVGSGSGYHAAVVAEIIAPLESNRLGHVYTIEIVPELYKLAKGNLDATGYSDRVTVMLGDGSIGYPEFAPYDRILVTAAAPRVLNTLLPELSTPGILVIPVGSSFFLQELVKVKVDDRGHTSMTSLGGVAFVPLLGKEGWSR